MQRMPAPPPAADGPPRRGPAGQRSRPTNLVAVGAEVALMAVTVAAVVGLTRLFSDGEFLAPVVAAALASHVVAAACRRMGMHALLAAAVSGIGLVLFVTWVVEPHTASMGFLPGPATWNAFGADLRGAVAKFGEVKAPVATTRGFVLACVVGTWMAAWLADLFAFRMRARFEALVPSFTVFLFGAMLGTDRHRVAVAGLYLAAVLAFIVLSDLSAKAASTTWFGERTADGQGAVLRGAVVVAAVAVVVGAVVGPHLPGAESAGLFGLGDRPGGSRSPRVTVSPLVDIRGRLVDQSDLEAFVVDSPEPSYWRLTSLEAFDGNIWSSRGTYQRVKGSLDPDIVSSGAATPLRQVFTVGALSSIWLPAAFRPAEVTTRVPGMRYERESASLLTDEKTGDGLRYTVESEVPRFSEAELAAATGGAPREVTERYLDLPGSFPAEAVAAAQEATAGQTTAFGKARALQDWFLRNFTYTSGRRPRPRQRRHRPLPPRQEGVLRAVRRRLRGDGPVHRAPRPGGRRLHAWHPGRRRALPRDREAGPCLARGLPGRLRVGAVRAHAGAHAAGRRLHRHAGRQRRRDGSRAGRLLAGHHRAIVAVAFRLAPDDGLCPDR